MLRERFKRRSLRFPYAEHASLARKASKIPRKSLRELGSIVTADRLRRWRRRIVAHKFDASQKRKAGRPPTMRVLVELIARMALENPRWDYSRIQGALLNLGHEVGRGPARASATMRPEIGGLADESAEQIPQNGRS